MLEWFAKTFEKMCSICATVNFIICGILGGFIGYHIGDDIIYDYEILLCIVFLILGVVIAFFINVMTFGFLAQITEIRRKIDLLAASSDSIDYMLKESNFDTDIEEIKNTVKTIEGEIKK